MKNTQRGLSVPQLTEEELNHAIADAQKADETCLVRRLCFVSNLYQGDTRVETGRRVVDREIPTRRWPRAWNMGGIDGLRPHFGGGRPP